MLLDEGPFDAVKVGHTVLALFEHEVQQRPIEMALKSESADGRSATKAAFGKYSSTW